MTTIGVITSSPKSLKEIHLQTLSYGFPSPPLTHRPGMTLMDADYP